MISGVRHHKPSLINDYLKLAFTPSSFSKESNNSLTVNQCESQ